MSSSVRVSSMPFLSTHPASRSVHHPEPPMPSLFPEGVSDTFLSPWSPFPVSSCSIFNGAIKAFRHSVPSLCWSTIVTVHRTWSSRETPVLTKWENAFVPQKWRIRVRSFQLRCRCGPMSTWSVSVTWQLVFVWITFLLNSKIDSTSTDVSWRWHMKWGATLRQPRLGRCQHCMMGKSHSGMTTNAVNCPECVGQSAARLVEWVTMKTVVDSIISRSKSQEQMATKDRPLGLGVCFTNSRNKSRIWFVFLRKTDCTARTCTRTKTHFSYIAHITHKTPNTHTQYAQYAQHVSTTDTRHRTPDRHSHYLRQ